MRTMLLSGAAIAVVCWIQPVIEQLTADGRGNLTRLAACPVVWGRQPRRLGRRPPSGRGRRDAAGVVPTFVRATRTRPSLVQLP